MPLAEFQPIHRPVTELDLPSAPELTKTGAA